jgi:hypothetical protein
VITGSARLNKIQFRRERPRRLASLVFALCPDLKGNDALQRHGDNVEVPDRERRLARFVADCRERLSVALLTA